MVVHPFFFSCHSANSHEARLTGWAPFWPLVTQQEPRAGFLPPRAPMLVGEADCVQRTSVIPGNSFYDFEEPVVGKQSTGACFP